VVRRADDRVDDHQPGLGGHRLVNATQDLGCSVVGPVVQDATQEVCIRASGDRLEEVTGHYFYPVGYTGGLQHRVGVRDDVGLVEEDASDSGVRREYGREHRAGAASDISDHSISAEVVRAQDV